MTAREPDDGWVPWTRETKTAELAEAVAAFEPLSYEAGSACARWLKEDSLNQWPQTVTWIRHRQGVIEGFFAMRSATAEIDLPRSKVWERREAFKWPCSVVEWLCRHRGDEYSGRVIINQAIYRAREVAKIQGNVALVIEPFNPRIAEILQRDHDFLRKDSGGHLWVPLYGAEDQLMPRSSARRPGPP